MSDTDTVGQLREACEPYLGQADISVPYFGAATAYIPAETVRVRGYVSPADLTAFADDPNGWRLNLLGRAHELIGHLAGAGWILNDAPVFEFRGQLDRATFYQGKREVAIAPKEYGLSLSVSLDLIRADPASKALAGERWS
jgi:hypothetical protein